MNVNASSLKVKGDDQLSSTFLVIKNSKTNGTPVLSLESDPGNPSDGTHGSSFRECRLEFDRYRNNLYLSTSHNQNVVISGNTYHDVDPGNAQIVKFNAVDKSTVFYGEVNTNRSAVLALRNFQYVLPHGVASIIPFDSIQFSFGTAINVATGGPYAGTFTITKPGLYMIQITMTVCEDNGATLFLSTAIEPIRTGVSAPSSYAVGKRTVHLNDTVCFSEPALSRIYLDNQGSNDLTLMTPGNTYTSGGLTYHLNACFCNIVQLNSL
jgi:hypothetical protein